MMTMLATFQSKRNLRWAIALILLLLEVLLWVLLIGVPWQFGAGLPRPICESGKAEHWIAPFWAQTLAGWKSDYDAFLMEVIVLVSHLIIAIAVPIAAMERRGGGETGRRERTGTGNLEGYTGVAVGSLRTSWWFAALSVGAIVFFVGQAVAAFRFGAAWADGVGINTYNEIAIGAMLHDQINAILYMSLTIGLALASIVGRWLLSGLSCTSFTIFLIWMLFAVAAFIPPFFVSSDWLFWSFEDSAGQKDCAAIFGDGDDELFARSACDVRAGTYIAGIILILISILGPIFIGLIDYARVVCLPRRRAWIDMPDYWQRLVDPANPKFRTFANAGNAPLATAGYRSEHTSFFNFDSKLKPLTVPADKVSPA